MKLPDFSIVILAAGHSSRMGKSKQLLDYKGKTLLRHIADEALNSGAKEIIIVVNGELVDAVSMPGFKVVLNADSKEGMASSIRAGIAEVIHDEVILAVCDQPYVTAGLFKKLIMGKTQNGKGIAASSYAGTLGTPSAFNKKYFPALAALKNDEGAKRIIAANTTDTQKVNFPDGDVDIDTPDDYDKIV